jgi:hypothetical protein
MKTDSMTNFLKQNNSEISVVKANKILEKSHFKSAATGIAIKVILETTPPHFHLSL